VQAIVVLVILVAVAVALYWPARRYGERLIREPTRPEYRTAAILNTIFLVVVFAFIIVTALGPAGIPAAIAGAVVAIEVGALTNYGMIHYVFGQASSKG
jgi:uncharacterized membrane protein